MTATYSSPTVGQDAPWQSRPFWIIWPVVLVALLIITMIKDYALTGNMPNPVYYAVSPLLSLLFGTPVGYAFARLVRLPVSLIDLVALLLIMGVVGQVFETVAKLIYYYVIEYSPWLFLAGAFALVCAAAVYSLLRWRHLSWGSAVGLVVVMHLGQVVLGIAALSILGISTPGS